MADKKQTLRDKIAERRRKMDEMSGYGPVKKKKPTKKKEKKDYKPPEHGRRKQ